MSPMLCAAVRELLRSTENDAVWSNRAVERITELRDDLRECCGEASVIARMEKSLQWWTFAGQAAIRRWCSTCNPISSCHSALITFG
jgi:hypothetical protein